MIKSLKLGLIADYSEKRIKSENVSIDNYITIDNILQNKAGITKAINLPPNGDTMPKYNTENILVGNIRPYLKKIWFADRDGGCSSDVLVFKVKKDIYPKFVYYALFRDDFFNHMMRGKKGTKMPRGDKDQILDFLIPEFNFNSQQNISSILSSLDSKIEINNRINTELEKMAKTIYDYWFVQFDFPDENGRPYKSSGGKMVWNEELRREIPEGWGVKTIEKICKRINSGGTPSTKRREFYNGDIFWYTTNELQDKFLFKSYNSIANVALNESSAKLFPIGTILIAIYASPTVGRLGILTVESAFNQACCGIVPNEEILSTEYIFLSLLSMRNLFNKIASGTAQKNLSVEQIKFLNILNPSEKINHTFQNFVKPFFEMIKKNQKENIKLSELRDWLLPMLMNGQVKVE